MSVFINRAGAIVISAATMIFACGLTAAGQTLTAPAVKAAFLFNFVKFATWRPEALPPGQKLSICVAGDAAVADSLRDLVRNRWIDDHEISVALVQVEEAVRSCQLLYVGASDKAQSLRAIESVKGTTVLTVGTFERFAESGGMVELYLENDRMRFAINLKAADRAGITFSSRLLSLAKLVKE